MKDKSKDTYVSILKALVVVLAGVILLVNPGGSLRTAVKVFGAGVLAYGIFTSVSQLLSRDERQPGALTAGLTAAAVGAVVLIAPGFVSGSFSVLAGLVVMIGGVKRFTDALALRAANERSWVLALVLAVVCIALGVLILANPFGAALSVVKLVGIVGIYYGLTALVRLLRK